MGKINIKRINGTVPSGGRSSGMNQFANVDSCRLRCGAATNKQQEEIGAHRDFKALLSSRNSCPRYTHTAVLLALLLVGVFVHNARATAYESFLRSVENTRPACGAWLCIAAKKSFHTIGVFQAKPEKVRTQCVSVSTRDTQLDTRDLTDS